tara:strand:+ start:171 stop:581 length:411 start_codon:yes stop_codon:yes gene_type:complete
MEPIFVLEGEYGITAEFYESEFVIKSGGIFNLGMKSEETINYQQMESVEYTKGFMGAGFIAIDTIVEKYDVYFLKEKTELAIQVKEFLEAKLKENNNTEDQLDITDQLKKLKDLLDMDAISEEEFKSAKAKLLKKL